MKLNRIPKPILILILIIALVALWHFGSKWYFSQREVKSFEIPEDIQSNFDQAVRELRQRLSELGNESLDNSSEVEPISPEMAEKMQEFNDFLNNPPFLQYENDAVSKLIWQYDRARDSEEKFQVGKQISKFYLDFHDFHIELLKFYAQGKLPYEPGSAEFNIFKAFIDRYKYMIDEMDDPFLLEAFREEEPEEDSEHLKAKQEYEEWLKTRGQEEEYYKALEESLRERTGK